LQRSALGRLTKLMHRRIQAASLLEGVSGPLYLPDNGVGCKEFIVAVRGGGGLGNHGRDACGLAQSFELGGA